ncbi:MAG: DUF1622 domain-containing protein [Clostridia bacterium]|nr:DUF1622 domain-containing protein [Clostridia bacterium]MBR6743110.1 DUF1622 domain-containing protein [Clostridia bacterium]
MLENVFHNLIENFLPFIISILEIMGILVVGWSAIKAFWEYIQNTFFHKRLNLQYNFAQGLATGLEFKMAGEILNTVLIREIDELYILGAVILLRALLSILIHFELKETGKKKNHE